MHIPGCVAEFNSEYLLLRRDGNWVALIYIIFSRPRYTTTNLQRVHERVAQFPTHFEVTRKEKPPLMLEYYPMVVYRMLAYGYHFNHQ